MGFNGSFWNIYLSFFADFRLFKGRKNSTEKLSINIIIKTVIQFVSNCAKHPQFFTMLVKGDFIFNFSEIIYHFLIAS